MVKERPYSTATRLIYKSKIVRDYLLDVAEMLDELEASGN